MTPRGLHRLLTTGLSSVLVLLGVVAIVRTAFAGGTGVALGYVLGVGLIVAGTLRLYVMRRTS